MQNFYNKAAGVWGILFLFLFFSNTCSAQVTGDFKSNGTGGGVWNVAATWLVYNGVSYVATAKKLKTALRLPGPR
jgi:hypothetical protein